MSEPITSGRQQLEQRNRYRRLMNVSLWGGIAGLFVATLIWVFVPDDLIVFAGVGVYWLGFVGYLAIWKGTCETLFDEREQAMELKASGLTLGVLAYVVVFGVPGMVVLSATGTYTVPSAIWDALVGYVGVFVLFAIAYTYVQYTHS
ncbi:hypothetical protein D8Y22_10945 [Salinadaptatus halalkaliphilus]|uniref:DUF2178 domain-containing protein n=1 Tax=Salinadaptatus halalkaliphilus TaxID=2419781 RepID=A0A4V3VL93_9EURY|nr:hypothetical protein [Salinadaptatus halalkaliphilus]THE64767.1 hypothetical protein D8Y22_10945 [Salinadaptatus halalkaliphilus]